MKNWTNDEWVVLQQKCGREIRLTELEHGPKFNCLILEKGRLIGIGGSQKGFDEAITACREMFVRRNILLMIDKAYTTQLQKANLKEAKMILQKSET